MDKKSYRKHNEDDSLAITDVHKRRIDVSPKGFDRETIIHELIHAYIAEMCIHSCDLDADNLEEFFAELFAKRAEEILEQADDLMCRIEECR